MPEQTLESHLSTLFGHASFRPGQRAVVESVMAGRDTLAVLPTGGGKSVTYQLPAMLMPGLTLILSPLIALMKDQLESLPPAVSEHTTFINSSLDFSEVARRLRMVSTGRIKLIYAAPERLRQPPFLHALRQVGVSMVVVDEAHCISQWGHDFRPDYRAVGRAVEALAPPVALAVTATATPLVRDDIERQLGRRMERIVRPTFRDNLHLSCRHLGSESEKLVEVVRLARETAGSGLIYSGTRDKCEQIAAELTRNKVSAGYYHAGIPAEERAATQDRFMSGEIRVMVATVAFGMGVDKPDIRALVHYHPSRTLENYYQEAGRAGRDGQPSHCTLLFSRSDAASSRRFLRDNEIGIEDLKAVYHTIRSQSVASAVSGTRVARVSWDEIAAQVTGGESIVRMALPLLEEVALVRRHTDIPRAFHVIRSVQGTSDGQYASLVAAAELGGAWGPAELSAYAGITWPDLEFSLLRAQDAGALGYRANQRDMLLEILPSPSGARDLMTGMLQRRGQEAEHRMNAMLGYVRAVDCRHAVIGRYFGDRATGGKCGVCDICDGTTKPFQWTPTPARSVRPPRPPRAERVRSAISDEIPDADEALYARLREWRTATAKDLKIPGYCVFPDKVLHTLAAVRPETELDMQQIPGIGPRKADKYGGDVLRILGER